MKKVRNVLLVALVALTVVSMYSVAGTYAKYTSTYNAESDTARVAKWGFKLGNNKLVATNTVDFELFGGDVYELTDDEIVSEDSEDHLVPDATGAIVIAPGTGGKYTFVIKNESEVHADLTVKLTNVTNAKFIPVEFSAQNKKETDPTKEGPVSWVSYTNLDGTEFTRKNVAPGATETIVLYWRWKYNGTDAVDTGLGEEAYNDPTEAATIKVEAQMIATQVD